jgi:hypothetical protein
MFGRKSKEIKRLAQEVVELEKAVTFLLYRCQSQRNEIYSAAKEAEIAKSSKEAVTKYLVAIRRLTPDDDFMINSKRIASEGIRKANDPNTTLIG